MVHAPIWHINILKTRRRKVITQHLQNITVLLIVFILFRTFHCPVLCWIMFIFRYDLTQHQTAPSFRTTGGVSASTTSSNLLTKYQRCYKCQILALTLKPLLKTALGAKRRLKSVPRERMKGGDFKQLSLKRMKAECQLWHQQMSRRDQRKLMWIYSL